MGYPILSPQVRWGTPFLVDFWGYFRANLAPSWATLAEKPGWLYYDSIRLTWRNHDSMALYHLSVEELARNYLALCWHQTDSISGKLDDIREVRFQPDI